MPLRSLALLFGLFGPAAAQEATAIPPACEALEDSGAAHALGPVVAFEPVTAIDSTALRLDQCRAVAPGGAPSLLLILRQIEAGGLDLDSQMARFAPGGEATAPPERLELGDGALWFENLAQLAVWHRQGQVLFVLTAAGEDPQALAVSGAEALLRTYP
ncbi:hypothetical protein GE300_22120 [Rhodobacteraceae bacterium 2CG4]|uniref:Uncharacterized protein n=1 Tax=Halovulum marinum TaxID=2662447 RepID=A0A6L5Z763_9RHOB|nr:hypothetical protein [Halovulum marinum]MSU92229.1 hypothetical protein [Halovulum marinum]